MGDYDYIIVARARPAGAGGATHENPATKILLSRAAREATRTAACRFPRPADRESRRQLVLPVRARAGHGQSPDPCRAESAGRSSSINGLVWVRGQTARLRHLGAVAAADGAGARSRRCSPDRELRRRRRQQRPAARRPVKVSNRARPEPLYDALFAASRRRLKLNPTTTARTRRAWSRRRPRSTRAGA